MQVWKRMITAETGANDIVRLWLSVTVCAHGAARLLTGDPVLGNFLQAQGWPAAHLLAALVSTFEVAGAILLALRVRVVPIAVLLSAVYLMGILLFHRKLGFYVIGPNDNGYEYSLLLMTGLLATAWDSLQRAGRLPATRWNGLDALRLATCALIAIHGFHRLTSGSPAGLGAAIESNGLPYGVQVAIAVSVVEIAGAALLAARLLVLPLATVMVVIYETGIVWFHWHWGFFVVSPGDAGFPGERGWGWEYSAMLIASFAAMAWRDRACPVWPLFRTVDPVRWAAGTRSS